MFHTPVRKKEGYVSKVTLDGKPIRATISFAKFVYKSPTVLRVWIPDDSHVLEVFKEYDESALSCTITQNNKWFNNSLDKEAITNYFRPSVTNGIVGLLLSSTKPPIIIKDGVEISLTQLPTDLSSYRMSIEVNLQGLYFFSQKFGLRWVVKTIYINSIQDDDSFDMIDVSLKSSIEDKWEEDLEALNMAINKDIDRYDHYTKVLRDLRADTQTMLDKAREQTEATEEWNGLLAQMAAKIAKYYNGSLFYL